MAVIFARNPVHSVLWLIVAFFNAAGLMLLVGAEFIAMLLVIVYVGAVAVLFLFVVMMLDIDFASLRSRLHQEPAVRDHHRAGAAGARSIVAVSAWKAGPRSSGAQIPAATQPNIVALGQLLYSRYLFAFEIAGLILLVAMIGAIVLTHRSRGDTRTPEGLEADRAAVPRRRSSMLDPGVGEGMKL